MVMLIEELIKVKDYKVETSYLAVSIADRYLVNIAVNGEKAPCLITLAVVCVLMGAKMEQPVSPSFNRIIHLMYTGHGVKLDKQELINLEEKILRTLEFSCHHVSPIPFLERYLRIYGVDQAEEVTDESQIYELAFSYSLFMQRESHFLKYRPSQIAATALVLAINISISKVAPQNELK